MKDVRVAIIGGGNGLGQGAQALLLTLKHIFRFYVDVIIGGSFDDDDEASPSSNGQLRRRGRPGYYSDLTWVLGKMRSAIFGDDWLLKMFGTRFRDGIHAEPFGNLLVPFFGAKFLKCMDDPEYRDNAIETVCKLLKIDQIKEEDLQELTKEFFDHCLQEDHFGGHSFRNITLAEFEDTAEGLGFSPGRALEMMHRIYRIPSEYRAAPVTWNSGVMKARTKSGHIVPSQRLIDFRERDPGFNLLDPMEKLWIDPPVSASEESLAATGDDIIFLSCGSLSNIQAPFSIPELKSALRSRRPHPPVVYVMNFMTEAGITRFAEPYDAADVVDIVQRAIGMPLSCIVYDDGRSIPKSVLRQYQPESWIQLGKLENRLTRNCGERPFIIRRDLAMMVPSEELGVDGQPKPPKILHDPQRLGAVFRELILEYVPHAVAQLAGVVA